MRVDNGFRWMPESDGCVTEAGRKPVDGNDIRLPTDGYNSPDTLSQLGFKETVPQGGVPDRPGPTTSDRQSRGPQISQGQQPGPQRAEKPRKRQRSASAAPGFSLND